jgi:uncharacterized protein
MFIDSGAFIARYRRSDDWHGEARRGWSEIRRHPPGCFTTMLVLAETTRLLRRDVDTGKIAELLQGWLASPHLTILRDEHEDDLGALRLMTKYADQQVGLVDCISFALMRRYRIRRAFTFDRHFEIAGFEVWPQRTGG